MDFCFFLFLSIFIHSFDFRISLLLSFSFFHALFFIRSSVSIFFYHILSLYSHQLFSLFDVSTNFHEKLFYLHIHIYIYITSGKKDRNLLVWTHKYAHFVVLSLSILPVFIPSFILFLSLDILCMLRPYAKRFILCRPLPVTPYIRLSIHIIVYLILSHWRIPKLLHQ